MADEGAYQAEDLLELYRVHAAALADAIEAVLPRWVRRSVQARLDAAGRPFDDAAASAADDAAARALAEVSPKVRALVLTDPDDQVTTPLSILRDATSYATGALQVLGVPAVERDEFAERSFPDDPYDLAPAAFADVDPELHEPGMVWGAAKAHVHLTRRRAEGRR